MTVDKGQDIIARKDSTWYFIQVKTTSLDSNKKACWKIPKHTVNRFYAEGTMKYVLVARCSAVGKPQNRIFCFSNDEINTFTTQGYISQGRDDITITIQYSQDNVPYLCSGNAQTDVSKWGNLDSIIGRRLQHTLIVADIKEIPQDEPTDAESSRRYAWHQAQLHKPYRDRCGSPAAEIR